MQENVKEIDQFWLDFVKSGCQHTVCILQGLHRAVAHFLRPREVVEHMIVSDTVGNLLLSEYALESEHFEDL